MKLIDSSYEIIEQPSGLMGVYKQIEKAARTAYKSEDKITDDSAPRMVEALCKSNHGACLEHGTIYLDFPENIAYEVWSVYEENPYCKVVDGPYDINKNTRHSYVTTNARVIFENGWQDDLKYMCDPTENHEKRITVKFIASIGVVREILRHRKFSFLNESTRYCNYSKNKFGNELTFIIPEWAKKITNDFDGAYHFWKNSLKEAEWNYTLLINECELKAEEARGVLPLDLKSELIVTGFVEDWVHFFRLRSHIAATGKPHPDIQKLADPLMQEFIDRGYCTYEDIVNKNDTHLGLSEF